MSIGLPFSATSSITKPSTSQDTSNQVASPIQQLPEELIVKIFGFLTPKELAGASCVSREWNRTASDKSLWNAFDLKKLFPKLSILDEAVWNNYIDLKAYGLSFEDLPTLDKRAIISTLTRLFASLKIEKDAGITLLTMPKGLTLNKLEELAQHPKQGNATGFRYIWPRIKEVFGDVPVEKSHVVAITNSVLENSRNKSVGDQAALVKAVGCEMPGVKVVATLCIVTYISSPAAPAPTRLYGDGTYTPCPEQIDGYNLVGGGFAPAGLDVDFNYFDYDDGGVGALRKFEETSSELK